MKNLAKFGFLFVALYLILFPASAYAYLDPGTGSYIIQVVAAVLFAGLFLIKTWWRFVSGFISKILGRKERLSEKSSSKEK